MDGGAARRGRSCRRDFGADDDLGSLRRSRCCKDCPTTAANAATEGGVEASHLAKCCKYDTALQHWSWCETHRRLQSGSPPAHARAAPAAETSCRLERGVLQSDKKRYMRGRFSFETDLTRLKIIRKPDLTAKPRGVQSPSRASASRAKICPGPTSKTQKRPSVCKPLPLPKALAHPRLPASAARA